MFSCYHLHAKFDEFEQDLGKKMSLKNALLSQFYLPLIGWKSVMNPDDKQLSDLHWELKVIFFSEIYFFYTI